jgi:hypothetical protein
MKSSNLAQRLEELDAVMESLRLTPPPTMRITLPEPTRPVRRAARVRTIHIREQGLRGFRVF